MHFLLIVFVIIVEVMLLSGMWKTLSKAGRPGWGALIPGYNIYLFIKIAELSNIWLIYCLIPFLDIIFIMIIFGEVSKRFGVNRSFAFGLLFLPFIFFPILGFGRSEFKNVITA